MTDDTDVNSSRLKIEDIPAMANVAEKLEPEELDSIGARCKNEFELDLSTRADWESRMVAINKLVLQVLEQKSFPWVGASSVKFPLLTIAAIQYHARAYPALVNVDELVRYRVFGDDPTGQRELLGSKVSQHMTYQCTEEDDEWEENQDRALLIQPIVGCAFKKIYYDPFKRKNKSILVFPKDLVISYFAKSIEDAPRLSQILHFSHNDIRERVLRGMFLDVELGKPMQLPEDKLAQARDKSQGMNRESIGNDSLAPHEFVEQHRWMDLDRDDYQEPYIVTFERGTGKVVRIVARFISSDVEKDEKGKVLRITPIQYFQKIPFVPAPDGGIYDIGFGMLLHPLNESVNTIINQLVDSGTLNNLGGGFLGRGVKIRGGNYSFAPGEWKPVDSTGDDLNKSIVPLPRNPPSDVLFNLLGMLVEYSERTSSSVDAMVGVTPGQNTPAETSRNAMEAGMKVFNAIYKRTYSALKQEFRKLYKLNQIFLPEQPSGPFKISRQHYMMDPTGIRPAADPSAMSDSQRIMLADVLRKAAMEDPSAGWDRYEVNKRFVEALKTSNVDAILPPPGSPKAPKPAPDPKMLQEQTRAKVADIRGRQVELRGQDMAQKHRIAVGRLMIEAQKARAVVKDLEAKAVKALAEAKDTASRAGLETIRMNLDNAKAHRDGIMQSIEILNDVLVQERENEREIADRQRAEVDEG